MISGEGNYTAIDLELLKDEKARDIILNKTFLFSPDQARFIGDSSILKKNFLEVMKLHSTRRIKNHLVQR